MDADLTVMLGALPIGARLFVKGKKEWRVAVVSQYLESGVLLRISSGSGRSFVRTYAVETELGFDGRFFMIGAGHWSEGLTTYDRRW